MRRQTRGRWKDRRETDGKAGVRQMGRRTRQRGRKTRDRWEGRQETDGKTEKRQMERQMKGREGDRLETDGKTDERQKIDRWGERRETI